MQGDAASAVVTVARTRTRAHPARKRHEIETPRLAVGIVRHRVVKIWGLQLLAVGKYEFYGFRIL